MSDTEKKQTRLFLESVKDRHTSHWDLDLVSKDELEAIMGQGSVSSSNDEPGEAKSDNASD